MTNSLTVHGTSAATDAFLQETEGVQGLLLPTVKIGEGVFTPSRGNDPATMDKLPDGSKARPGKFIAKRVGVLSWRVGYDQRAKKTEGATTSPDDLMADGGNEGPAFVAFAPDSNVEDVILIGKAAKARQMSGKATADKWDFATSKVGHLKPILELLVWFPETGFTVITTSPNYHDVVDGVGALKALVNPDTGEISLPSAMFKPVKKDHKSKTWEWSACFCETTLADAKVSAAMTKGFGEYQELIKENLAVKASVDAWLACSDRPMTDEIRNALKAGIALNPPKY